MSSDLIVKLRAIAKKLRKESFDKEFIVELWDGTKVYLVDGEKVRDSGMTAFYGGCHPLYEDFPTKGEIWIEKHVDGEHAEAKVFVHEITEYILMKYAKKPYDPAHDIANSVEQAVRALETRQTPRKASLKVRAQQEESKFEKYFDRRSLEEKKDEMAPELYDVLVQHRARVKKILEEADARKEKDEARLKTLVKGSQRGLVNLIDAVKEISDIYERRLRIINSTIGDLKSEALDKFLNDPKTNEELQEYLAPIHSMQATLDQEFKQIIQSLVV
jgi:hypothetical protein